MKASKAPKKIYMQENTTTDCYGEFWPEWFEARSKDADIEYIRKDALLEWAKIKQTQCLENSTAHVYFQMFIDKINCM